MQLGFPEWLCEHAYLAHNGYREAAVTWLMDQGRAILEAVARKEHTELWGLRGMDFFQEQGDWTPEDGFVYAVDSDGLLPRSEGMNSSAYPQQTDQYSRMLLYKTPEMMQECSLRERVRSNDDMIAKRLATSDASKGDRPSTDPKAAGTKDVPSTSSSSVGGQVADAKTSSMDDDMKDIIRGVGVVPDKAGAAGASSKRRSPLRASPSASVSSGSPRETQTRSPATVIHPSRSATLNSDLLRLGQLLRVSQSWANEGRRAGSGGAA